MEHALRANRVYAVGSQPPQITERAADLRFHPSTHLVLCRLDEALAAREALAKGVEPQASRDAGVAVEELGARDLGFSGVASSHQQRPAAAGDQVRCKQRATQVGDASAARLHPCLCASRAPSTPDVQAQIKIPTSKSISSNSPWFSVL